MTDNKMWLTAAELAGIASLPSDPCEVAKMADKFFWESRKDESGNKAYNLLRLPKNVIDFILFSRVGLKFAKGCNSKNTQTWFISKELVGVGGISDRFQTINVRGRNEDWIRRKALRGNKSHMFEFHVSTLPEVMQVELGFIPKAKDFNPQTAGEWYTAKQLAGHAGMPSAPSKVTALAREKGNKWKKRISQVGKGRRPFEFHIKSLPPETQASLLQGE
ncbi:DNA-binding protein [Vibrio coralliirubri]|uniref:DNA-binding protein n=1 Tax=Vibrio coralliirubri TaxID=1516159 RepID=UPI002283357A|nr:DNA-binding protein [Vibrio coralliirubri]MCY9861485.1 DNA-binding protein [Vibrio coralliirubri]